MKTFNENTDLSTFNFWSGAKALAEKLTFKELEEIEFQLDELHPEGISETHLNDLFWFEEDFICGLIGENAEEVLNREKF